MVEKTMVRRVCTAQEVQPGRAAAFGIEGTNVLVCNVENAFYCVENVCTHDGAPLDQGELDGCRITCPRHGAIFDVTTGSALRLPAVLPLPVFRTTVQDGVVFVDLSPSD